MLAELPLSDAQLEPVAGLVNRIEEALASTEATQARVQSIERFVDQRYFKTGEPCPVCHRNSKHSQTCYMRPTTGWDLLAEHEATLHENDELRQALAVHLPHNGKMVLSGGKYKGLKARARTGR
jgi:hypothetical protein